MKKLEENNIIDGDSLDFDTLHDRKSLVEKNMKLVHEVAKHYIGAGIEYEDLVQEGSIGLIKASMMFDPNRGSFSTYAVPWIRKTIIMALNNNSRMIRLPSNLSSLFSKFNQSKRYLTNLYGREPKIEESAANLNITVEEAIFLEELHKTTVLSIDSPLKGDECDCLLSGMIPSDDNFEDEVLNRVFIYELFKRSNLTDEEIHMLSLIYGLNDGVEKSFSEVGKVLGVTKQAVHKKEGRILNKIRRYNRA